MALVMRRLILFLVGVLVGVMASSLLRAEQEEAREEPAEPQGPGEPARISTLPSPARCQAKTGSGKRCSRSPEPGSRFCWQHQPAT